MARVSIHIVSWNSMRYLPQALESIAAQTYRDFSVIVVDNASTDGSIEHVRDHYQGWATLRNANNRGFAVAHNQAVAFAHTLWQKSGETIDDKLVLVTNPDILLEPDFLEKLVAAVDAHPEAGSFACKLRKVVSVTRADEQEEPKKTTLIDSTGLLIRKSRAVVERGAALEDGERYAQGVEVFGVSGALALYRMSALDMAAVDGELFDEDFFAYKEDVDLAWRLRTLGIPCWYVPEAVAYHYRNAKGSERRSLATAVRERREKSPLVNFWSTRNHWLMLVKNDTLGGVVLHGYRFFPYEIAKLAYLTFSEPRSLKAIPSALALTGKMLGKRKAIRAAAKARGGAQSVRKWLG